MARQGRDHEYEIRVEWTGNRGQGTRTYTGYDRAHTITAPNRPPLLGSSDAAFRGDGTRYNPEDLLVASLSSCHMLWFLHLAADAGVVVTQYVDEATGTLRENPDGASSFVDVVLRPVVTVEGDADQVELGELHHQAHERCFIARSVNFPVRCEPRVAGVSVAASP